jgi:hypothetical protein
MPLPVYAKPAAVLTLSVILPAACAMFDAFAPPGPRAVTFVYAGETDLAVGPWQPLLVTVLAEGVPLPQQRLLVESSAPTVLTLNARGDSLLPCRAGQADLRIWLVHSSATRAELPDTAIALRVSGGAPPPADCPA